LSSRRASREARPQGVTLAVIEGQKEHRNRRTLVDQHREAFDGVRLGEVKTTARLFLWLPKVQNVRMIANCFGFLLFLPTHVNEETKIL